MENTETYSDTAQTDTELNQTENPAESQTETQGETLTYNTDEIYGVQTETGGISAQTETTTAVQPITETAYTGVTAEQFNYYQTESRAGTIFIIFMLAMIFGALIGWGFSKIWRM